MTTIDKARELEEEEKSNQLAAETQKEFLADEDFLFNHEINRTQKNIGIEHALTSSHEKHEYIFGEEHGAEVRRKNEELNKLQNITTEEDKCPEDIIREAIEIANQLTTTHDDSGKKNTNPKDAIGISKVPMSVLSGPVMMEVGLGMMEGALKYGRHNFREAGVRASVYFDALMRHAWDWWEGEDIDPDSQLSHITKAISTLMVLRDSMIRENWVDDRPPKVKSGWIQGYNKKAKALLEKYPNPVPAHTQLNTKK